MAEGSTTPESGAHLTVTREVTHSYDRTSCLETWEGPYDECLAKASLYTPGQTEECKDIEDAWPAAISVEPIVFVASVRVRRGVGNVATCQILFQALYNLACDGMEVTAVEKPIENWRGSADKDPPDLHQIEQWKKQKESNYAAYAEFLYDGVNPMTGNTLELAWLIFKGIESYTAYIPVVTLTTTYYSTPEGAPDDGAELGRQCTPAIPSGCTPAWSGLYLPPGYTWVGTGDRCATNNDYTRTRIQQWTGFYEVEDALYPPLDDNTQGGGS